MKQQRRCRPEGRTKLSPAAIIAFIFVAILAVENAGAQAKAAPAAAKPSGMTLQEFLNQVEQNNGNFRSLKSSREAAAAKRVAGDIELATKLSAKYDTVNDKKPTPMGTAFTMTGSEKKEASLGLAKKFSTGTEASLSASVSETTNGSQVGNAAPTSTTNAFGALGVSVSQSLWKNFFGASTDLRREREALTERAETGGLDVQQRQVLIQAESAFWDHVYLTEELRQRKESLDRARRLETWMKRRVSNGIGDNSDLIGVEALISGRELKLIMTEDELTASTRKMTDLLELKDGSVLPEMVGKLDGVRDVSAMIDGQIGAAGASQVVSFEAYIAGLEAKAKSVGAQEVAEEFKPDLVLSGAYKTNSVDTTMSAAANNISDTKIPTTQVGLSFTYLLDQDVKDAKRNVAKMQALSAQQIQERKMIDGRANWDEMNRRHKEMTAKIKLADRTSVLQHQKVDAEKDKLGKGRSTTSTVITAEEEAAEGRLTLARIQVEQRKLEAQGRMFIRLSEEK